MKYPYGVREPFDVVDGVLYFHDWRNVYQGDVQWRGADGLLPHMMGFGDLPELTCGLNDSPTGIRLFVHPATKSAPVLDAESAGERFLGIFGGSLRHEGSRYRLWYPGRSRANLESDVLPGSASMEYLHQARPSGTGSHLRYAESSDGITWDIPRLGVYADDDGSYDNNICFDRGWDTIIGAGNVFEDDAAPAEQRYKMLFMEGADSALIDGFAAAHPESVDPAARHDHGGYALFGAVSPDGIKWTALDEPMAVQLSDTRQACEYDPVRRTYVAYVRSWVYGRRSIARTESATFDRFPLPQDALWTTATMRASEGWYTSSKTRMPGTRTYHLMLPMLYDISRDAMVVKLASSHDNATWNTVFDEPLLEPGEPGEWDAGTVWSCPDLVDLPGERTGFLYAGSPVNHKFPRRPPLGGLAWAYWARDRIVSVQAERDGEFATWPIRVDGDRVRLNVTTSGVGRVDVEVVGPSGSPVPGRSFDDCDSVTGDHMGVLVTWSGHSDVGLPAGTPMRLRFRLRQADLFSVRFA